MLSILGISAMAWVGTPYQWGGFSANGIDCSALVVKSFHNAGIYIQNMNSQQLFYWTKTIEGAYSCDPKSDCLLFYGKDSDSITHVAIALNEALLIEAGGAGRNSLQMTREELLKNDARVRVRPINHRKDLIASIKVDLSKL
jgi:cell wall-associated NlpC family hydrolase